MSGMLNYDNPVFGKFAFYSGVVLSKTMLMGALTVRSRVSNKIFANQEDVDCFAEGNGKPTTSDQKVERIRRCHLNDIENVIPFILAGSFYIVTNPDPWWASLFFRTFAASRLLHTVCYMAPLPQPSRFLCCVTGWLVTAAMVVNVIRAGNY